MLLKEPMKVVRNEITLHVNGETRSILIRNADTLLYTLREKLGLTGAKPGCLNGDCGDCTVEVNGEAIKSCIMLAIEAANQKITTVEGLQNATIQTQFIEKFAFQCGYCTPGFIMNCNTLVEKYPRADDKVIKKWLESNICRCTGYKEIEDAVKATIALQQDEASN